jgi:protein SCO1
MKSWLFAGVGVLIGLIAVLGFGLSKPYSLRGAIFSPAQKAPDFFLRDVNQNSFRLSDQKNRLVLLFFGYTRCPDVCPQTMMAMKQIRASLGTQAKNVDFVFISVDPAYDTPAKVKAFVNNFDPNIIGLSGTEAELQPVWKAYGVYRESTHPEDNSPEQIEAHSAEAYLVDRQGRLRLAYSEGTAMNDMAQDIRFLLTNG